MIIFSNVGPFHEVVLTRCLAVHHHGRKGTQSLGPGPGPDPGIDAKATHDRTPDPDPGVDPHHRRDVDPIGTTALAVAHLCQTGNVTKETE